MANRVLGYLRSLLYAQLFGNRDTDLGGNEIFMRPPKILAEAGVVQPGIGWKIEKALSDLKFEHHP